MKCKICANDDPRLLIEHQATLICRKCIMFQKGLLKENTPSFNEDLDAEYVLEFQLSNKQLELSKKLITYVEEGHDVLVYAACGSGKTEIVLELIKRTLEKNLEIGRAHV